ncbi:hypothetical protein ACFRIC_14895 [Streptomyces sp. NPDC056738]|uniref:hypothetical protein n=1 Tax=Streptomyces sp. NPDC056738 TaxID=3345933 RepID=UPI0036821ACC
MESQTVVSLASTGIAGLAVAASLVTTLLSLRAQRENTRDALEAQERLSSAQEEALQQRSHAQDLRDRRAEAYLALMKWADQLLAALDEMDEATKPYLAVEEWNTAPGVDNLLDLYASDAVHVRYAALRGRLIGLVVGVVATDGPRLPKLVTWTESEGVVGDVATETGSAWSTWSERDEARVRLMDEAIALVARVRAEVQGRAGSGYFVIWRLV